LPETTEGLDKKLSLHYYSRLRFITNLLPLVRSAVASDPPLARVISVLGAGHEGVVDTTDLSLRNPGSYSIRAAANHAISMTSLSFEHLAAEPANKGISFIHSNPGGVDTNIGRNFGPMVQKVLWAASSLILKPTGLMISQDESGERHVWMGTSESYKSGLFLVGPHGEKAGDKALGKLKTEGTGEKGWSHTEEVFHKICNEDQKYGISVPESK
jgi:hypothetical protein